MLTTLVIFLVAIHFRECVGLSLDDAFTRRIFLSSTAASILACAPCPSNAIESLPNGLLETRVTENVLSPIPYGMEAADVLYPDWFRGTWKVASQTTDVLAPCGVALFGGNTTYARARQDISNILRYESRFLASSWGCVADRDYNVQSISRAAMGVNSVMDVSVATPNKFSCVLAPHGSPSPLQVDLITLARRQENFGENRFDCSEVVREIVKPVEQRTVAPPSVLKEVETISLYTFDPVRNQVTCRQRSATFLLPSQQNLMAMQMFEAARGRPVDVRFYNIEYTPSKK